MREGRHPFSDPAATRAWLHRPGGPTHVPSLDEPELAHHVASLVAWVDHLQSRFELDGRAFPACWTRHPGMVEALTALRDVERGCYAPTAPATGGVEFLGALHQVQVFLLEQVQLSGCTALEHRPSSAIRAGGAPTTR